MELLTQKYEVTTRLASMIKKIAEETQLNESWVFAALLESRFVADKNNSYIFDIKTGRRIKDPLLTTVAFCIPKELEDKVKHLGRMCSIITDDGIHDMDETVCRLLILALTDRECEFKPALDPEDVGRLYLANPELGLKH
jgi:hypothetical protein